MQDYADAEIFDLGKGQKQRIALASVLTLRPSILVIDEPTTGQDPEMTEDIFRIINDLNQQGTTVIMITHEIDYAARFAKRALVMNHGHLVFDGAMHQLLENQQLIEENSLDLPDIAKLSRMFSGYGVPANTVRFEDMHTYMREMVGV